MLTYIKGDLVTELAFTHFVRRPDGWIGIAAERTGTPYWGALGAWDVDVVPLHELNNYEWTVSQLALRDGPFLKAQRSSNVTLRGAKNFARFGICKSPRR